MKKCNKVYGVYVAIAGDIYVAGDGTDGVPPPITNTPQFAASGEWRFVGDVSAFSKAEAYRILMDNNDARNPLGSAASVLGRKGGSVKSERKARSSRENGRKGGRPAA